MRALRGTVSNPLPWSIALGGVFSVTGLHLPGPVQSVVGLLAVWRTQWPHALVVATLGPLGYVLVLYALQLAPLSHVAPAREVSTLLAALLGGRLLGESERGLRVLGAACIAGGVMALALG